MAAPEEACPAIVEAVPRAAAVVATVIMALRCVGEEAMAAAVWALAVEAVPTASLETDTAALRWLALPWQEAQWLEAQWPVVAARATTDDL